MFIKYEKLKTSEGKKKLYNYMANQLINKISDPINDSITLVVDKCKNKYERKNFDQYIKIELNHKLGANIRIFIQHDSSQNNHCLQAVDLFCWGIRRKNALADNEWYNCYTVL